MATITGATNEKVYSIPKWLGLNEHPDGDTRLKLGEASLMENWKITRDGNLKRRPGSMFFAGLNVSYVLGHSDDVVRILECTSGKREIDIYYEVTVIAPQGTVTMIGTSGVVERGNYRVKDASVEDGTLVGNDDPELNFVVENGVLRVDGNNNHVTIAELAEILADLGDGEYVYTEVNDVPYRIRNDGLTITNGCYVLSGYKIFAESSDTPAPVTGLWSGIAGGKEVLLAACDGRIWSLYDATSDSVIRTSIGTINTDKGVNFIPFDNKVYIQNGYEYYVYDGTNISVVNGYIPIVAMGIGPQGTADAGDIDGYYVNLLTNKRKVWLSPDGDTNKTFKLPEVAKTVDSVVYLDGSTAPTYTFTANTDEITFTSTLVKAVNSIEVQYSVKTHSDDNSIPDYRAQVTAMKYAEIFSGGTDQALFFYGDGTNKTLYTGMDYDGMPRPDYFPDQYEAKVGDSNTPITAMVRHYSVLMTYKTNEAWAISYGTTELATGALTTAVYVTPVNRDKGNVAPAQVRLVNNNPVTCSGSELYQWTNSSYYTSNLTRDERQARRISDRVQSSVKELDFENCCMWDDDDGQEFYISGNGITLVWNYATDTWYKYTGLDAVKMCNFHGDVIYGTSDGRIFRLTYEKDTDDGRIIEARWESGSMDFGASNVRKYSSMMWLGMKPVDGASVDVCVETDRKNTFKEKIASSDKAKVPGQPFPVRSKIKAKKFTYYRLILSVNKKMPAVTITNVDFRVRQTGYSK